MKKFISISLILTGIALIATVVVWYLLQGLFIEKSATKDEGVISTFIKDKVSKESESVEIDTNDEAVSDTAPSGLDLTPAQRQAAESVGIDPDAITITADMIDCASQKLSAARIDELFAGAAPTVLETLSLIPCLKN